MDRTITLTYTDLRGIIAPGELEDRCRQAAPVLARAVAGDPAYQDFTGWRTVEESAGPQRVEFLQQQADRVRADADAFVTIGIGGSNQSSRAAIKALRPENGPAMLWAGNTISAREMADTLEQLDADTETLQSISFTLIRKYLQQLIINADKQGASKSREHITFISGRFSAFLLRNRTPFLRADI